MSAHFKVSEIGVCLTGENAASDNDLGASVTDTSITLQPFDWLGRVLSHFAKAERAIGLLCIRIDLPVEKGPLGSLEQLCNRLAVQKDKQCQKLLKQIKIWRSFRPLRHLLAHASPLVVHDSKGNQYILTRHLPLNRDDVTPDRLWTQEECQQLCKTAARHGQSIADQVRNLLQNSVLLNELKKPNPGSSPG